MSQPTELTDPTICAIPQISNCLMDNFNIESIDIIHPSLSLFYSFWTAASDI
jgi:hypothetical protein